jgi:hypothetical protein
MTTRKKTSWSLFERQIDIYEVNVSGYKTDFRNEEGYLFTCYFVCRRNKE